MKKDQHSPSSQRRTPSTRSSISYFSLLLCLFLSLAIQVYPIAGFSTTTKAHIATQRFSHGPHWNNRRQTHCLTTTTSNDDTHRSNKAPNIFQKAAQKFRQRPGTYLLIPCIAAGVGWLTNWMAVQMIFYPIQFRGIPIWHRDGIPLGFLGWQGIVPCKTRKMSASMVDMVTSQLLSVKQVFARLDPGQVADLLQPEFPTLVQEVVQDTLPQAKFLPAAMYRGLDGSRQAALQLQSRQFLVTLVKSMQANIDKVFSLKNCVVEQMLQDRAVLGQLFRKCGQVELDFLTNSGLWFGFMLGIIQMMVALVWENPWTLSVGGAIVGYATNWLALKWIFQPVDPTRFGPFVLQGQFLRRQKEVSREFSQFFARHILTGERLWQSVLNDPQTSPAFGTLFAKHFCDFGQRLSNTFQMGLDPQLIQNMASKALKRLPGHVPVLYPYMDKTLGLEDTLRVRMEHMTSRQFERVLHPIFEEDELTLILAGAVLGFIAGLIQQGLETGAVQAKLGPLLQKPFIQKPLAKVNVWIDQARTKLPTRFHKRVDGHTSSTATVAASTSAATSSLFGRVKENTVLQAQTLSSAALTVPKRGVQSAKQAWVRVKKILGTIRSKMDEAKQEKESRAKDTLECLVQNSNFQPQQIRPKTKRSSGTLNDSASDGKLAAEALVQSAISMSELTKGPKALVTNKSLLAVQKKLQARAETAGEALLDVSKRTKKTLSLGNSAKDLESIALSAEHAAQALSSVAGEAASLLGTRSYKLGTRAEALVKDLQEKAEEAALVAEDTQNNIKNLQFTLNVNLVAEDLNLAAEDGEDAATALTQAARSVASIKPYEVSVGSQASIKILQVESERAGRMVQDVAKTAFRLCSSENSSGVTYNSISALQELETDAERAAAVASDVARSVDDIALFQTTDVGGRTNRILQQLRIAANQGLSTAISISTTAGTIVKKLETRDEILFENADNE